VNIYYQTKADGTQLVPLTFGYGPYLSIPWYMQKIGSFGDANVFYGAPLSYFSAYAVPIVLPPRPPKRIGKPVKTPGVHYDQVIPR